MTGPVFEEVDRVRDCDCPGCVHERRTGPRPLPGRFAGPHAARGVVVVAAAASAALGAIPPAAAVTAPHPSPRPGAAASDGDPLTPQGPKAPLHGPAGAPVGSTTPQTPATTRTQIINRAKVWVAAKVPYSMNDYWSDGYRQDCSGYVSMAWGLLSNEWTGSLDQFGTKITKDELQPGDILLFHNPDNPESGSHVVIFGGWTDYTHTYYTVYEQTPPHARSQATPYPYWTNGSKYVPYRYKGLTDAATAAQQDGASAAPKPAKGAMPGASGPVRPPSSHGVPGYPGRAYFRPGEENAYVGQLRRQLTKKGFGGFYGTDPGPHWSEADRRAVEAFQRSQGWRGGAADGYPGPETWRRLFA